MVGFIVKSEVRTMDAKSFVAIETDALPLEYKLHEWRSLRHLDVADIVNNASAFSVVRTNEGGCQEQLINGGRVNVRVSNNHLSD